MKPTLLALALLACGSKSEDKISAKPAVAAKPTGAPAPTAGTSRRIALGARAPWSKLTIEAPADAVATLSKDNASAYVDGDGFAIGIGIGKASWLGEEKLAKLQDWKIVRDEPTAVVYEQHGVHELTAFVEVGGTGYLCMSRPDVELDRMGVDAVLKACRSLASSL